MTKLTKAQRACLNEMRRRGPITVYDADALGSGGFGLSILVKKGLAEESKYANGKLWGITDAGHAALNSTQPKGN